MKTTMKKLLTTLMMLLALTIAFTFPASAKTKKTKSKAVKLNQTKVSLFEGDSVTLTLKNAKAKKVKWSVRCEGSMGIMGFGFFNNNQTLYGKDNILKEFNVSLKSKGNTYKIKHNSNNGKVAHYKYKKIVVTAKYKGKSYNCEVFMYPTIYKSETWEEVYKKALWESEYELGMGSKYSCLTRTEYGFAHNDKIVLQVRNNWKRVFEDPDPETKDPSIDYDDPNNRKLVKEFFSKNSGNYVISGIKYYKPLKK